MHIKIRFRTYKLHYTFPVHFYIISKKSFISHCVVVHLLDLLVNKRFFILFNLANSNFLHHHQMRTLSANGLITWHIAIKYYMQRPSKDYAVRIWYLHLIFKRHFCFRWTEAATFHQHELFRKSLISKCTRPPHKSSHITLLHKNNCFYTLHSGLEISVQSPKYSILPEDNNICILKRSWKSSHYLNKE